MQGDVSAVFHEHRAGPGNLPQVLAVAPGVVPTGPGRNVQRGRVGEGVGFAVQTSSGIDHGAGQDIDVSGEVAVPSPMP